MQFEVCHIFLRVYHIWRGTRIRNKCFASILFFMYFQRRVHGGLCILWSCLQILFPNFYSCINPFFRYCSFYNNWPVSCCICPCCSLLYLPWFSSENISWRVWVCCSNYNLVCSYPLYARSIFFVLIFPASVAGTLVLGFYIEGFLKFSWSYLSRLFFHLVKFHINLVTYFLNS